MSSKSIDVSCKKLAVFSLFKIKNEGRIVQGNPIAYRNLYKHLVEILNYLDISLDSDFILEELNAAQYECEVTFGKKHQFTNQLNNYFKDLYQKYIDKKALPLEVRDENQLRGKINEWLQRYYQKGI